MVNASTIESLSRRLIDHNFVQDPLRGLVVKEVMDCVGENNVLGTNVFRRIALFSIGFQFREIGGHWVDSFQTRKVTLV